MNVLHTSLRCLGPPSTLLSIGLLLLNDHVLKATAPSWLTGKLSDFAGLFFFPFLLAVLLSLILDGLRVPPRRTGWLAFGLTAAWFTLIKTSPWANGLAEDALSRLLGLQAQIVLDPTDLIALFVLWPAWRLWTQMEQALPNRTAWIAFGLAALATMGTAPSPAR